MSDGYVYTPVDKFLAIFPKFLSLLSGLGSYYIVHEVVRNPKKRTETYERLVAAMSVFDIFFSTGAFLGTWPMPSGRGFGAAGTTQSCTAVGFVNQWGGACTPMYNAALGIYYVLHINLEWPAASIKKFEMISHFIIISVGFACSVVGIPLKLYNPIDGWVCWISPMPLGCQESWANDGETTCERGDNATIYQWAFYFFFGYTSFVIMVVSLIVVYMRVNKIEKELASYCVTEQRASYDMSKSIFVQGVLYCLSFTSVWFFPTVQRIYTGATGGYDLTVSMLIAITLPLQGFWNAFIYVRPKYRNYRKTNPHASRWEVVKNVLIGVDPTEAQNNNADPTVNTTCIE